MTYACGCAHFRSGVLVAFSREIFMWGGALVFAGYDSAKRVIVVGKL